MVVVVGIVSYRLGVRRSACSCGAFEECGLRKMIRLFVLKAVNGKSPRVFLRQSWMALLRQFAEIAGDMPGVDAEGRTVKIFVTSVNVKCRLQTELSMTRSQKRFFLSVYWQCLTVGQMENKTIGNCCLATIDSTVHKGR